MVGCPLRLTHLRQYTPIAAPDSAVDHIAVIRHADELQTLWSRDIPVGTVGRAVEVWLRLGNDPVVHTSLPTTTAVSEKKTSPFSCVEDYMGTNLVAERPAHVKDSAELWMSYFEAKYLGRMRQSRRTSANFIGILNATAALTDEADHPNTKWSADTQFSEVAYLSERHLKEKVSNPMQLEQALWLKADVDAFLAFHQSYTQQTSTRIPLPVPSLWVHEGEARKLWANKYLHALRAARAFFDNVLAADVKAGSPARVCKAVAEAFEKVNAILLKRRERQVKAGLVPSSWVTAPAEQRAAWVANEVEAYQRSIQEDNFDPEDLLDSAPEWTTEHAEIGAILEATVDGMNLTLKDFWTHTIRLEELETEHVLESEKMREVAAAARAALYAEQPYGCVKLWDTRINRAAAAATAGGGATPLFMLDTSAIKDTITCIYPFRSLIFTGALDGSMFIWDTRRMAAPVATRTFTSPVLDITTMERSQVAVATARGLFLVALEPMLAVDVLPNAAYTQLRSNEAGTALFAAGSKGISIFSLKS